MKILYTLIAIALLTSCMPSRKVAEGRIAKYVENYPDLIKYTDTTFTEEITYRDSVAFYIDTNTIDSIIFHESELPPKVVTEIREKIDSTYIEELKKDTVEVETEFTEAVGYFDGENFHIELTEKPRPEVLNAEIKVTPRKTFWQKILSFASNIFWILVVIAVILAFFFVKSKLGYIISIFNKIKK